MTELAPDAISPTVAGGRVFTLALNLDRSAGSEVASGRESISDLPAYTATSPTLPTHSSRHRRRVKHVFASKDHKGEAWLVLTLQSSASSPKSVPMIIGGEPVSGQVDLKLQKPQSIQSVVLVIKGSLQCTSANGSQPIVFYKHQETLWDNIMGDPGSSSTPSSPTTPDGKLQGNHRWSFSKVLPTSVTFDTHRLKDIIPTGSVPLPPNFSENGSYSIIRYDVDVKVKRSGFFHRDEEFGTMFQYTPRSKPASASLLRQTAYRENTPLLGPAIDSLGWKIFPRVVVQGTLFNVMKVDVACSFALATPLAYTRGSVIPCAMTLQSENLQALDVLSSPQCPTVHFVREIQGDDYQGEAPCMEGWEATRIFAEARWWKPNSSENPECNRRELQGEISLPRELKPSFSFGIFYLKYRIELHPFKAPGFVPATEGVLLRANVDIMTDHADGPRPRRYLPPDY
ncbi:hypothetical protein BD410DRAFT_791559 [Rickenella mellea]|uniref:Arrestin-like N-terminal domain-containing protein n=1 Tax=Rickenella mellea TaxID=50990 RepID=A0A4Y7PWZ1_9AGAM|nr:hypothetical protein BD410DRAFT_791559 [Rickenella mellea]